MSFELSSLSHMTICMGAICESEAGPAVVIASDRMVTWANLTEFEHQVPKIHVIGPTAVVLIAGDALTGNTLAIGVRDSLRGQALTVEEYADALANTYVEIRMKRIEADLLRVRGLDLKTFYAKHQELLAQITGGIDMAMQQYDLGVELLVAGIDGAGGHLFTLGNPGGRHLNHDVIGHAAVGSGMIHALQSMIGFQHASMQPIKETIFRVYASKRRAELAPGVGRDTDLMLLDSSGPKRLTKEALEELAEVYAEFVAGAGQSLEGKIEALELSNEEAAVDEESATGVGPDADDAG